MKRYILFIILFCLPSLLVAQMSISLPLSRGVYQIPSTGNASVVLAGQYLGSSLPNYRIEYIVYRLNVSDGSYNSTYQGYTTIVTNPSYGLYRTTMNLPIGWYSVDVRVYNISTGSAGVSNTVKFGVGDVYVIAGQSNAQGVLDGSNSWSVPSLSTYDGVVSHNYNGSCNAGLPPYPVMTSLTGLNRIAPSGNNSWNWAYLGQQLQSGSPSGGVPIAFFNASAGGSNSNNWKQSAAGTNTTSIYGVGVWCTIGGYSSSDPAQPYYDFKTTLKYYTSIFGAKAILWHQGESDNDAQYGSETTRTDYANNLQAVITQSRSDFSSSLRWLVSEVSFNGKSPYYGGSATRSDVTLAQNDVTVPSIDGANGTSMDYSYTGVITDPLGLSYRDASDLIHFREDRSSALSTVGGYWDTKIRNPTNGYANVPSITPPLVSMNKSGSTWYLTIASGSYSEYRWLNMTSPNPNSPVGTSNTLSGTGGGSYACLAKNSSGNWTLSQTFYTGCGSCREGVAELEEWKEEDLGLSLQAYPIPFDKEFTIEFSIPNESMVRLELINSNGQVINKIAENIHARGTYKYAIKSPYESAGMFFYRLTVNGVAITKKLVKN